MSLRNYYELRLKVTVSFDDERIKDVTDLLKARVNEMLGRMEHNDDIRISLVQYCEVKEIK